MKKNLQLYIHIALWMVYSLLLVLLLNKNYTLSDTFSKAMIMLVAQIGLFYINSLYLFPKLITSKNSWKYILSIVLTLLFLSLFFYWFERQFIPDNISEAAQMRMNRLKNAPLRFKNPRQLLNARFVFQLLSLLIILILSSAYSASQIGRKKELSDSLTKKESLQAEMNFLKSQINPHFLFNALNNIYSLTLSGSEKSSEMILKLSAMLRYILYECNGTHVAIENEWDYILNFIDFQRLKSKDKKNIELEFNNEFPGSKITPMILIPFIENAFKHSNIENTDEGWMRISLNNKLDEIIFQVDNSKSNEILNKDDVGGIGLDNVKRRLDLVYAKNYDLIINDSVKSYSISLRIQKKI
jgi:sensor histidine kinase YesM